MSTEWVRKMHRLVPLTLQELRVKEVLRSARLDFEPQYVLELTPDERFVADFFVRVGDGVVVECLYAGTAWGMALGDLLRRGAYVDYRFAQLKASHNGLEFVLFIEAPQVPLALLMRTFSRAFSNVDKVLLSVDGLLDFFRGEEYG